MTKRQRVVLMVLVMPLIALLATAALHRSAEASCHRGGAPQCPTDCGVKLEHAPWVHSGDRVVIAICFMAGRERFSFTQDGTDGCYTVTGLGTTSVTVTENEGGERREHGDRGDRSEHGERDERHGRHDRDEHKEHESECHRHCEAISSVVFYFDCSGGGGGPPG